jgi:hypothetical protein
MKQCRNLYEGSRITPPISVRLSTSTEQEHVDNDNDKRGKRPTTVSRWLLKAIVEAWKGRHRCFELALVRDPTRNEI